MTILFVTAVAAGVAEAAAAVLAGAPDVMARAVPALFAVALLGSAWAMWARSSMAAVTVAGAFLLIEVAWVPFYPRDAWSDWVLQGAFTVVAVVGIAAWVGVLRERRAAQAVGQG